MAQLPCLANLDLGVPTAVNKKKERTNKEKAKMAAVRAERWQAFDANWLHNNDVQYKEKLAYWKQFFEVDVLRKKVEIISFLTNLVRFYYQNYKPYHYGALGRGQTEHDNMWALHNKLATEGPPAAQESDITPPDSAAAEKLMRVVFFNMAEFLHKNYVWMDHPKAGKFPYGNNFGLLYGPEPTRRSPEEVERIINEPDTEILLRSIGQVFGHWFPKDQQSEWYIRRGMRDKHQVDDTGFLEYMRDYWMELTAYYDAEEAARMARLAREAHVARAQPRPAPAAPEPKSTAEFEANKQKNDEREKLEALERLELNAKQAAQIAQSRAEAHAKKIREEQEREDANAAGSSRAHAWPTQPLSPGSRAKQLAEEQEALEAKARRLQEFRERLAKQVEEEKKEQAEQQRRADEMEHALRVANVHQHGAAAPPKDRQYQ